MEENIKLIEKNNYLVIQGWMITELCLKGNELLIYAIIYGFSQSENQYYSGSLQYLAEWTSSTKQGVIKCLKSLVVKGYIKKNEKYINNVKFCEYYSTKLNGVFNKVYLIIKNIIKNIIKKKIIKKKNCIKDEFYIKKMLLLQIENRNALHCVIYKNNRLVG